MKKYSLKINGNPYEVKIDDINEASTVAHVTVNGTKYNVERCYIHVISRYSIYKVQYVAVSRTAFALYYSVFNLSRTFFKIF